MAILNNNPGNIIKVPGTTWQGAVYPGNSLRFVTFESLPFGFRALYKVLLSKISRGINTIDLIIREYAPESDSNPTENYINYIESITGINRNKPISSDLTYDLYKIGYSIAKFETGVNPPENDIREGFNMAINGVMPEINVNTASKILIPLFVAGLTYFILRK